MLRESENPKLNDHLIVYSYFFPTASPLLLLLLLWLYRVKLPLGRDNIHRNIPDNYTSKLTYWSTSIDKQLYKNIFIYLITLIVTTM